jgi:mono/diheme cytochrome c family protein
MRMRRLLLSIAGPAGLVLLTTMPALAGDTSYSRIERGRYLVSAGDCAACHTAEGGKPFAGGRAVPTPFGKIFSTNLTPDKETGIGSWTEQDFYKAMHEGIDRKGEHLYPAFPYPWFTKLTRDDVGAIKAYLDTLQPVSQESKPAQLPWPMSWRGSVAAWNKLYFHPGTFQPQPGKSAEWNRGAYLVQGPAHCAACHTPKNMLGATEDKQALGGGDAGEHWYAPSLTGGLREGLGHWSQADIVEYLKTGSNGKTAAAGPMVDVITHSTQHLNDSDLRAIATYLKDMPARGTDDNHKQAKADDQVMTHGAGLYLDNCAGCHMSNGRGQAGVFPSLAGSSAIQAGKADTLVHMVLAGDKKPATSAKPTALAMPSFEDKLNNQEIADLVTYVRNAWGNSAAPVSADTVAAVRKDLAHGSGG